MRHGWLRTLTVLGSHSLTASDSVVCKILPDPLNNTLDSPHLSWTQKVIILYVVVRGQYR